LGLLCSGKKGVNAARFMAIRENNLPYLTLSCAETTEIAPLVRLRALKKLSIQSEINFVYGLRLFEKFLIIDFFCSLLV
jgi:hypothetical protein